MPQELLRHHGDVWRDPRQRCEDDRLGVAIGARHRALVPFELDLGAPVEMRHDRRASSGGGIGQGLRGTRVIEAGRARTVSRPVLFCCLSWA